MEQCEVCSFTWHTVDRVEVGPRIAAATAEIAALIVDDPARSAVRPTLERWSATQYAAHVRDVLITLLVRAGGLVSDRGRPIDCIADQPSGDRRSARSLDVQKPGWGSAVNPPLA